jgi:hypothetical protein
LKRPDIYLGSVVLLLIFLFVMAGSYEPSSRTSLYYVIGAEYYAILLRLGCIAGIIGSVLAWRLHKTSERRINDFVSSRHARKESLSPPQSQYREHNSD